MFTCTNVTLHFDANSDGVQVEARNDGPYLSVSIEKKYPDGTRTRACLYGPSVDVLATLDDVRCAIDAALREANAGPPLPEPVGNAA